MRLMYSFPKNDLTNTIDDIILIKIQSKKWTRLNYNEDNNFIQFFLLIMLY